MDGERWRPIGYRAALIGQRGRCAGRTQLSHRPARFMRCLRFVPWAAGDDGSGNFVRGSSLVLSICPVCSTGDYPEDDDAAVSIAANKPDSSRRILYSIRFRFTALILSLALPITSRNHPPPTGYLSPPPLPSLSYPLLSLHQPQISESLVRLSCAHGSGAAGLAHGIGSPPASLRNMSGHLQIDPSLSRRTPHCARLGLRTRVSLAG